MTNQDTSVEKLQTQVNQVTIDIDAVKAETSDTLKKLKAEAAINKIKATKEEITKKLEALNKLTDANAKADVAKLEAMLATLESFSELEILKVAVVTSVEVQNTSEAVDNAIDFTSITTGIEALKVMVAELKTAIDTYRIQKATMGETDKAAKEKEIEEKKAAIETKRKEIQTLIDKIKKIRAEVKLDDIPDETVKAALKTQKETEEKNITDYQKQLNALSTPTTTFIEKLKNGAGKIWESVKEKAGKTREWAKENPKTAIAATAGIGLLIRGISKLFRRKKEKKEKKGEDTEKKGFRDKWYGKALKRGLIGTGVWYLGKWLLTGKRNPLGNDNDPKPVDNGLNIPGQLPENADVYEKLPEGVTKMYEGFGTGINTFYDNIYDGESKKGQEVLGASDFEKNSDKTKSYTGVIPYILDTRYNSVKNILDENAMYYEIYGSKGVAIYEVLKDKSLERLKGFIVPLFKGIDKVTFGVLNSATTVDDFITGLKSVPNIEEIIRIACRKTIKTMAYLENRKKELKRALVEAKLKKDNTDGFNSKNPEDQQELIDDYCDDSDFCKKNIDSDIQTLFLDQHLLDRNGKTGALKTLETYKLMDGKINQKDEKAIQEINEDKKDILGQDDVGAGGTLTEIKTKLQNGKIDSDEQKSLKDLTENMYEHMTKVGNKNRYGAYLPILDMLNTEDSTFEKIMEGTGYKTYVEEYKKQMDEITKKAVDGTLTIQDIEAFEKSINEYFVLQKELTLGTNYITEVREENSGLIVRRGFTTRKAGEQTWHGMQMIRNGGTLEKFKGAGMVVGSAASLDLLTIPVRWILNKGKFPYSPTLKALKFITKKSLNAVGLQTKNIMPAAIGRFWYASPNNLYYDLFKGKISLEKATKIAKYKGFKYGTGASTSLVETPEQFLEYAFPGKDAAYYAKLKNIFTNYTGNDYIIKNLLEKNYAGGRFDSPQDRFKMDKAKMSRSVDEAFLSKLQDIDVRIQGLDNVNKKVLQSMMKYTKDIESARLFAAAGVDAKYAKYIQEGADKLISAEKFGKYLGKYGTSVDDLENFMKFVDEAKAAGKVTSGESFIRNGLKNWSAIKDAPNKLELVESLHLNKGSVVEKFATKVGEARGKAKNMFSEGMNKIKNLFKANPKVSPSMNASMESNIAKQEAELANVSEDMLNNPGTAENAKVLKPIFSKELLKRILNVVPLLIDVAFTVYQAVGDFKQADEIKKTNVERAEVKENEAYFNITMGGISATIAALGIANIWNPGGRVILAVTAGIETVKYAGRKYYEVVDTYYRNFEDFKSMYMSHIKQEVISKEAWGAGIDISVQERFQEGVSAVFGAMCHGDEKKVLSLKTREDAIRALIWMEECENYPYATLSLDQFAGTDTESVNVQTEINRQKEAMQKDSNIRYEYIKNTYHDKFIAASKLSTEQGKQELDRVLLESRQYLAMSKDTTKSAKDISGYQKELVAKLKENPSFDTLEKLYATSPLQFHKIMKSLPYFGFMFQQLDKTTYKNYDTINTNMEYVVKYYQYKTFGALPSDIPDVTIEGDQVDYMMIETFFTDFSLKPTGLTKEDLATGFANNQLEIMTPDMVERINNVSPNIGQNVLYRIAKEVLGGYSGKNTLDDLKVFYSPAEKEHNGLYYEDEEWKLNQTSNWYSVNRTALSNPALSVLLNITGRGPADKDKKFATDETLNDVKNITALAAVVSTFTSDRYTSGNMVETDTGTAEGKINKEYGKMINGVIAEELAYRKPENIEKYKADALAYIKANSGGKYIPLSLDLINNLTKAGIINTAYYYYRWDGSKMIAMEAVSGAIPTFRSDKKCGLTDNVETYTVKDIEYSGDVKTQVEEIDGLASKLSALVVADGEDLNLHDDIKKMIAAKNNEWTEIKTQLKHMDQKKAKTLLDQKYPSFKTFFDNTYMMILHCASSGSSSNDVNSYDDYLLMSNHISGDLLKFSKSTGSGQVSVAIPDFEYNDEFNTAIATYQIPGINKSISTLLYSTDANEVEAGKQYANAILKSILESAMLEYDSTGATITEVSGYGARGVDEELLKQRIAINIKNIKVTPTTKTDATTTPATKPDDAEATKK